jgi:uncharacterized membrane protein YvbJ
MKCTQCGTDLLAESNFCHKCGTSLKSDVDVASPVLAERVFDAKDATTFIWQSGESGIKLKLAASNLSASREEEEHTVYSIEELVRHIRGKPNKTKEAGYDPNEIIFHIFTAWR